MRQRRSGALACGGTNVASPKHEANDWSRRSLPRGRGAGSARLRSATDALHPPPSPQEFAPPTTSLPATLSSAPRLGCPGSSRADVTGPLGDRLSNIDRTLSRAGPATAAGNMTRSPYRLSYMNSRE